MIYSHLLLIKSDLSFSAYVQSKIFSLYFLQAKLIEIARSLNNQNVKCKYETNQSMQKNKIIIITIIYALKKTKPNKRL